MQTEELAGQVAMFDRDTWSGRTCPEPSAATAERTSDSSSKRPQKWRKGTPAFLDLRGGRDGRKPDVSWAMGGLLLGEYTTRSFGEYPREENASRLSQILEDSAHPKYSLSARACQGILTRAARRGKELPEPLRIALEAQSASKSEPESPGGQGNTDTERARRSAVDI